GRIWDPRASESLLAELPASVERKLSRGQSGWRRHVDQRRADDIGHPDDSLHGRRRNPDGQRALRHLRFRLLAPAQPVHLRADGEDHGQAGMRRGSHPRLKGCSGAIRFSLLFLLCVLALALTVLRVRAAESLDEFWQTTRERLEREPLETQVEPVAE